MIVPLVCHIIVVYDVWIHLLPYSAMLFCITVLIKAVFLLLFLAFNTYLKIIFMSLSQTVSDKDIVFRSWIHPLSPLTPVSRDALSHRLVEGFRWNLLQKFITCMVIAEEVLKVIGQRSRSYVYKCVSAVTVKAYILTVYCRDSLVLFAIFCVCTAQLHTHFSRASRLLQMAFYR